MVLEIIALRISDILHWSFQVNARAWMLNGDQMRLYSRTYSIGTFKFVSKFCDISLLEKVLTFSPRKSILFAVEIFLLPPRTLGFDGWITVSHTGAWLNSQRDVSPKEKNVLNTCENLTFLKK